MGTDTETKSSNPSEMQPLEEFDPKKEPVGEHDESDVIEPLNKATDDTGDQEQEDESDTPEDRNAGVPKIPLDEVDGQVESDVEEAIDDASDKSEIHPGKTDSEVNEPDSDEKVISLEAASGDPDSDDGVGLEDATKDSDPADDGDSSEKEAQPAGAPKEPTETDKEKDFAALEDDEIDDGIDSKSKNKEPLPKSTSKHQNGKKSSKYAPSSKKIIVSTLIIFMVTGAVIYSKPGLFGHKEMPENALTSKAEINKPVKQTEIQVRKPAAPGKNAPYLSKIEEINRLRDVLLAKKEEIYRLKLYYRNGIVELMDQIYREMLDANISTYVQALANKRIELSLRTIQRRMVYIQELEKPDQWAHNGSEELLFLKRKAMLDLQIADIAGGIDLNRHMRYMNAALQKYHPSADKLAVDPPPAEFTPLESIWHQILRQQAENVQTPVGQENEKIIAEICSGNYGRIAELTAITPEAARCLTHKNGSELFLNGLTQLTPKEAKYLFKWEGNWICLNSVKMLSPAVAKYLFKWEGNWISLNGLTELSPELALYLTEWKGKQLELMGLKYENSKPNKRTLTYLTLWETRGGKLFVSEDLRKEMARVM
jgi:hypothetical protein